jgi:hypothetical protein
MKVYGRVDVYSHIILTMSGQLEAQAALPLVPIG